MAKPEMEVSLYVFEVAYLTHWQSANRQSAIGNRQSAGPGGHFHIFFLSLLFISLKV